MKAKISATLNDTATICLSDKFRIYEKKLLTDVLINLNSRTKYPTVETKNEHTSDKINFIISMKYATGRSK